MDLAGLRALAPESLEGEVRKLKRKELQSVAKELRIRANTTNVKLKTDILAALQSQSTSSEKVAERGAVSGASDASVANKVTKKAGKKRKAAADVANVATAIVEGPHVIDRNTGGIEENEPSEATPRQHGENLEFPVLSPGDVSPTMPFARSPVVEKHSFTSDVGFASGAGPANTQPIAETLNMDSDKESLGQPGMVSDSDSPKPKAVEERNAKKMRCSPPETEVEPAVAISSPIPNAMTVRPSLSDQGGMSPPTPEGNAKSNRPSLSDGKAVEIDHLVKRRSLVGDLVRESDKLGAKRVEMAYKRVYKHALKVGQWQGKMQAKMEGLEEIWKSYKAKSKRGEGKSKELDWRETIGALKSFGTDSQMVNIKKPGQSGVESEKKTKEKRKAENANDGGKRKEPKMAKKPTATAAAARPRPRFRSSMTATPVGKSGCEDGAEKRKPRASITLPLGQTGGGRSTVFNRSPSPRPIQTRMKGGKQVKPWA
ncbi:hypothetical protein BSKO_07021 [Bryopsis sp. KO-2023]|nr:hypothetical protein BSKO_07021 [Bryopsis sp. KO-2023]